MSKRIAASAVAAMMAALARGHALRQAVEASDAARRFAPGDSVDAVLTRLQANARARAAFLKVQQ